MSDKRWKNFCSEIEVSPSALASISSDRSFEANARNVILICTHEILQVCNINFGSKRVVEEQNFVHHGIPISEVVKRFGTTPSWLEAFTTIATKVIPAKCHRQHNDKRGLANAG